MKDSSNTRFGKLTTGTEYRAVPKGKTKIIEWLCTCDCGKTKWVMGTDLRAGYYLSCGDLSCKDSTVKRESKYFYKSQLSRWKDQARIRNKEFDLTLEQLDIIYERQNGCCYYTGDKFDINYSAGYVINKTNLSIDRIDNSKGYTFENVVLCTKLVNIARRESTQQEFLDMCRKVTERFSNS